MPKTFAAEPESSNQTSRLPSELPKALALVTPGRLSKTATRSLSCATPWVNVAYICPRRMVEDGAAERVSCTLTSVISTMPVFAQLKLLT